MLWPIQRSCYPAGLRYKTIDDLFGGLLKDSERLVPRFDISETAEAVTIDMELPGIEQKDIELTVKNSILTIKGEKKQEEKKEDKNVLVSERSYGCFERSLKLGTEIDTEKIEASFKNGVLTVTVLKNEPEKRKARSIEIKSA
ncbi:MAG: Hsp20/alpha crystallin family protein [Kiritimatiellales bacterium]